MSLSEEIRSLYFVPGTRQTGRVVRKDRRSNSIINAFGLRITQHSKKQCTLLKYEINGGNIRTEESEAKQVNEKKMFVESGLSAVALHVVAAD